MKVLSQRNYRLFWVGESISLLGDQFFFIALPWLVLSLTDDALAIGLVFALAGIPRAAFMLFGGILIDAFSPRTILMIANLIRFLLFGLLTAFIFTEVIQLWMLYVAGVLLGLIDAFYMPAQGTIVTQLVTDTELQPALTLKNASRWLGGFIGPIMAGSLISALTTDGAVDAALTGIAVSFGINAISFLISVFTLLMIHPETSEGQALHHELHIFRDLKEVVVHVWNDTNLRAVMLMSVFVNFFSQGPFFVGVPVLAETRFEGGASAFGLIMSAYGLGNLLGTLLGNVFPNPFPHRRGWFLMFLVALQGPKYILIGLLDSVILIGLAVFVTHVALGYAFLVWMTWMQQHTEVQMRGRVTSLFFLCIALLYPLSAILSGIFVEIDLTMMFVGAGVFYMVVVIVIEALYNVRDLPTPEEEMEQLSQADLRRVTHTMQPVR